MASTSNATGLGSPDGLGAGLVAVVIGSVAFVMLACVGVCCWTAYQQRKKVEEQRLAEEAKERRELRRASAEAGDIGSGGRSVVVPVDACDRTTGERARRIAVWLPRVCQAVRSELENGCERCALRLSRAERYAAVLVHVGPARVPHDFVGACALCAAVLPRLDADTRGGGEQCSFLCV